MLRRANPSSTGGCCPTCIMAAACKQEGDAQPLGQTPPSDWWLPLLSGELLVHCGEAFCRLGRIWATEPHHSGFGFLTDLVTLNPTNAELPGCSNAQDQLPAHCAALSPNATPTECSWKGTGSPASPKGSPSKITGSAEGNVGL